MKATDAEVIAAVTSTPGAVGYVSKALAAALGITVWRYHDHVLHDFGIALLDASGNIVRTMRHDDDSIPAFLQGVLASE